MMSGASMATYISLLHANMVGDMQDLYLSFIALWSLHVGSCSPYLQLPLGSSLGSDIMTL